MNAAQQAAFELRLSELEKLANEGADLKGTLLSACSSHEPAPEKQVRVIRFLLKSGVGVNETDRNGVTPLHRAVRFRSTAAVRELIAQGADINAVDRKTRSTPLHRAATSTGAPATAGKAGEALEIAGLLLESGAGPRIKNKNGKTPLDYARTDEMKETLRRRSPR